MLTEGKGRVSMYRVYWVTEDQSGDEYVQATSAQQAVNFIRNDDPEIEVLEVAKVVNNWK